MKPSKLFREDRRQIVESRKKFWLEALPVLAFDYGAEFTVFTNSHYRVSKGRKMIDFYPTGARYHIHHLKKRGDLIDSDIEVFMKTYFGDAAKEEVVKTKSNRLTIDSPMPIGKHKGTLIKHLPKSYLRYIYEMEYTSKEVMELLRNNPSLMA